MRIKLYIQKGENNMTINKHLLKTFPIYQLGDEIVKLIHLSPTKMLVAEILSGEHKGKWTNGFRRQDLKLIKLSIGKENKLWNTDTI